MPGRPAYPSRKKEKEKKGGGELGGEEKPSDLRADHLEERNNLITFKGEPFS